MESVNTFISSYNKIMPLSFVLSVKIILVFIFCLVLHYVFHKLLTKAEQKVANANTKTIWDDAIISSVIGPVCAAIWLIFANYILRLSIDCLPDSIILKSVNYYVKSIGLIIVLSWFLLKLVKNLEKHYFYSIDQDTTLDSASSFLLGKAIRVFIIVLAVMTILHTLDYNIATLLTVGGAGSIIIGFAAKDMLANIFGGLMVYLDKPFKVGDAIKLDNLKVEGTVERIGWRSTRLRNFDKRPVYIPNNTWVNSPVENITRMVNRRIKEYIGLRYQDASKIQDIIKDIETALENHDSVDHRQSIIIKFCEFGPSSLNIMVYVFTKDTKLKDFLTTKQQVFFMIIDIVKKHGADFAFPTTTLDIPSLPK